MAESESEIFAVQSIIEKLDLNPGMKVADLGCGMSGRFIIPCAKAVGAKGRVYAVDIVKKVLSVNEKIAQAENLNNIQTIWSNLEIFNATKINSSSLDRALLINTLFQSKQKINIFREAIRLIKKGGKIAVIEWRTGDYNCGPDARQKVDPKQLKSVAEKLGLEQEIEFKAGPFHYGMIFIKN